ncbi:hypothetical protein HDE_02810 [Halotydeus destructor]|nr:hypothetical protein HDE_02810 [Halotydeus destructor]
MMDQIAKMNDSFATLMNESVQVETVSTTSASEDTDESAIESQSDDENAREQETNGKPRLMKQISTTGFLEDLPLHSLETDQYGPSVQKYISKYLDDDLNTFLLNKKSKKEKGDKDSLLNTQQSARTIKAATKHIDAQGKRAISKHSSLSSVNLSCHSSVTPPPTPNYDFGADQSVAFGKQKPPSPSTTIISVLESQMLQEKEAVSPFREYDRRKHRKRQVNKLRIQERDAKGEIDGENSSHASGLN